MALIKLGAIDSTNDFLKQHIQANDVANFTVVTTEHQTNGKGQMGTVWVSEKGKNLIMSVFVKDVVREISQIFTLNVAVAVAIIEVLRTDGIPDLSIKWPNDIMSAHKKIAGILIENSIKSQDRVESVVGIGINVNQTNFEGLPNASSLQLVSGRSHEIEDLRDRLVVAIQKNVQHLHSQPDTLWENYDACLYKKGTPIAFEAATNQKFMGIIQGVNQDGTLKVLKENDAVEHFGIKEIRML